MSRLTLIAILLFPVTVFAQNSPTTAASANGVARTFLSFGQPYGYWLLIALDTIPASQYNFRPTPVQQSVGFIAQHLENANYELCARIGSQRHVASAKDSSPDSVTAQWPKDTLIAHVRASLEFCAFAIQSLSDAKLADTESRKLPMARSRFSASDTLFCW